MNENYKKILELCKVVIDRDYAPCGLKEEVERRLLELTLEWERRKEKADKEGKEIGGLSVILYDLLRATERAESDERRFGKHKCRYLRRGLQLQLGEQGALGNYSLSMWA